ncbi:MAG: hypothetical protein RL153_83 [Verrucomicrobiota bacterium]
MCRNDRTMLRNDGMMRRNDGMMRRNGRKMRRNDGMMRRSDGMMRRNYRTGHPIEKVVERFCREGVRGFAQRRDGAAANGRMKARDVRPGHPYRKGFGTVLWWRGEGLYTAPGRRCLPVGGRDVGAAP